MKKLICVFLIIILVASMLMMFTACDDKSEETAIIIIPGLLASALYDTETGNPIWDPITSEDLYMDMLVNHSGTFDLKAIKAILAEALPLLDAVIDGDSKSVTSLLAMDGNGVPLYNGVAPVSEGFDNPSRLYYGALGNSKELFDTMNERYGDKAEVKMFNYDWRLSNITNAKALEKFIDSNGYENVYLIGHSMGGHLSSCYMSLSDKNFRKVRSFISLDSPLYGSLSALSIIEDIEGMIIEIINMIEEMNIPIVDTFIQNLVDRRDKAAAYARLDEIVINVLLPMCNFDTLIELLPNYKLIDTPQYTKLWEYENSKEVTSFIKINDKYLTTKEEILTFYKSRDWAYIKKADGSFVLDESGNKIYRDAILNLETYFENMDIANKANTLYVNGIGYATQDTICYSAPTDAEGNPIYAQAVMTGSTSTDQGDGTVLLYSATLGKYANSKDVLIETNADHFDPAIQFNYFSKADVCAYLDNFFKN